MKVNPDLTRRDALALHTFLFPCSTAETPLCMLGCQEPCQEPRAAARVTRNQGGMYAPILTTSRRRTALYSWLSPHAQLSG